LTTTLAALAPDHFHTLAVLFAHGPVSIWGDSLANAGIDSVTLPDLYHAGLAADDPQSNLTKVSITDAGCAALTAYRSNTAPAGHPDRLLPRINATSILYGSAARHIHVDRWFPQHPALARLLWTDERTDIHGAEGGNTDGTMWRCACGWDTGECGSVLNATAALISHALHTCARCGGPKPATDMDGRMDVFPRCSRCAF